MLFLVDNSCFMSKDQRILGFPRSRLQFLKVVLEIINQFPHSIEFPARQCKLGHKAPPIFIVQAGIV